MADRHLTVFARALLIALAIAIAGVAAAIGWRTYNERYTVSTRKDDDLAVAMVVRSVFSEAADLKVSTLSGTVQGVGRTERAGGLLPSQLVMKAPYSVDYFIDLSNLGPEDFRWNRRANTLFVTIPDVRVATPNVEEGKASLYKTSGIFVTRGAMEAMRRQASQGAEQVTKREALKPERLAQARENGRRALTGLMRAPLAASGQSGVKVVVRYEGERRSRTERWDVSRSIEDVLKDAGESAR
jgi:hypothetical protein